MARSCLLRLVCVALVASAACAWQFRVGGQNGWSVPDANAEPYNAWAGRMRFQIGDQLLFVYPKETDSVLIVDPAAYNACNTTSPSNKFDDGNTVFTFDRSGPFFFISGNEANCRANEKLIVVVMADRSGTRTPPAVSPPSPSAMPPQSAPPMPSPESPPPSMLPPMPSPMSPPSVPPPMPSPMSPPSMPPPMPSPMSPPSEAPSMAPPAPTPGSAPSPTGSAPGPAPTVTPGSPPAPGALAPPPSSSPGTPGTPGTPGGVPPSASGNTPGGAENSTTPPGSGAAPVAARLVTTLVASVGYAILAI